MVVDAVGARPREHASSATEQSRATSAAAASVEARVERALLPAAFDFDLPGAGVVSVPRLRGQECPLYPNSISRRGNQRNLQPLDRGQQCQDLLCLAGSGERQHHVAPHNHS